MRFLIDGYNLMHAAGALGKARGLTPERFRKLRARFLDAVVEGLGGVDAHQCTVVFDANDPPAHLVGASRHRGLTVRYAVECPTADDLIEDLIDAHPRPRELTVVSSDARVRQAALRRKAVSLTSDRFLDELDRRREARVALPTIEAPRRPPSREEVARHQGLDDRETSYWMGVFGELDRQPETDQALRSYQGMPSDEEIEAIARQVDAEFRKQFGE